MVTLTAVSVKAPNGAASQRSYVADRVPGSFREPLGDGGQVPEPAVIPTAYLLQVQAKTSAAMVNWPAALPKWHSLAP